MEIILFKFLCSLFIFFLNVAVTALASYFSNNSFISKSESLAGGIFIGATVCNLFPEAIHYYTPSDIPIPIIIALFAFIFMFLIEKATDYFDKEQEIEEETITNKNKISKLPPLPTLILYLLLVFHCIIEGIAFGILTDKKALWALFFATIGHKPVECMVISIKLYDKAQISKTTHVIMMLLFCATVPLTIILFSFIHKSIAQSFTGFITAFSAGVFLFFGFHELRELVEKSKQYTNKNKIIHILIFLCGLIWMALLSVFGG